MVSGPAVVLLSMSPSYVGESSASSLLTISLASACLAAIPAAPPPPPPFVRPPVPRPPAARRPEAGRSDTEMTDAPLSVRGSLSSSEASYAAGESSTACCAVREPKDRLEWRERGFALAPCSLEGVDSFSACCCIAESSSLKEKIKG